MQTTTASTTQRAQRLSTAEIVERYLGFFCERGHMPIAGSPLVLPGNSTSFVIAGMQPLQPYLRGDVTPPAPRLTALQRCLRSDDADAVGTSARKLTCFHMLGNWSIGDYNRHEAISFALELLDAFGVTRDILWVTTFAGDDALGLPPDETALHEWRSKGIVPEHIVPLGVDDNLWPAGGSVSGLCGPCSEIFVDRGVELGCGAPTCRPGCACDRFLEIWNLVFIEYELTPEGAYRPLPLRSVDTGMGLERIASVLQDVPTVFDIDIFAPALARLGQLAPISDDGETQQRQRARRLIVDHVRAVLFAALAGVTPAHDGRGSVVRRLIRRAARYGRLLGLQQPFLGELLVPIIVGHGALLTPEERQQGLLVAQMLGTEEQNFARVLTQGLRTLEHIQPDETGHVPGKILFRLHAERGFPADLAGEVLAERGLAIDWADYERALEEHRAISRISAERRFRSE